MNKKNNSHHESRVLVNHQIRSSQVLCIDENNSNLGLMPKHQAINLAVSKGLDLVQVSAFDKNKVPTCKIIEFGKYKYDLSKHKKEADKKQRKNIIKIHEVKFRPCTAENDLKIKAKKAEEFLAEGGKVKASVMLKGREMTHQDLAIQTLNTFIALVENGKAENKPLMDNKNLIVFLVKGT